MLPSSNSEVGVRELPTLIIIFRLSFAAQPTMCNCDERQALSGKNVGVFRSADRQAETERPSADVI